MIISKACFKYIKRENRPPSTAFLIILLLHLFPLWGCKIQICTADLENEKLDRQNLKHQLNKIFKELFKAREQITRLEPLVRTE